MSLYSFEYDERLSFTDDFYEHALRAPAVKLRIKNLLPGTKIELAAGNRYHHFTPKNLPLQVRVAIIFTGLVVAVFLYYNTPAASSSETSTFPENAS